MTEKEMLTLAKDIVMYFDGLQMCGETEDVLEEMTQGTFEMLKAKDIQVLDELQARVNEVCDVFLENFKELTETTDEEPDAILTACKKFWFNELQTVRALRNRVAEVIFNA